MRKFLILSIAIILYSNICFADDLTPEQLQLRSEIKTFLSQEGFMPEIDPDGDIKFKKEGRTYYVTIDSSNEYPMYLNLSLSYMNPDGYTLEQIKLAASELNFYKGIEVLCYDSSIRIQGDMFLVSSETFKYVFYKLMEQIEYAAGDIMDELDKVSYFGNSNNTVASYFPFIVTNTEVANVEKNGNIIQDYGTAIYDYKTKYLKPRITITPFKTEGTYTIYVKLYQDGRLRSGTNSPEGYSFDSEITLNPSKSTYLLSGWGNDTSGHWKMGDYRFEFWYNGFCIGSHNFRVY